MSNTLGYFPFITIRTISCPDCFSETGLKPAV